jgi:hypothetical protein
LTIHIAGGNVKFGIRANFCKKKKEFFLEVLFLGFSLRIQHFKSKSSILARK